MIKKIIHIGDVHIRNLKRLDEMRDMLEKFISECKVIVDKEGAESVRICVCGDVFENHISVSNEAMACCSWFFRELDQLGCTVYIVAGNHDYSSGNVQRMDSLSPVFDFGYFLHLVYLDKDLGYKSGVLVDDNVVFCLFSQFSEFSRPDIETAKHQNEGKKIIGLIHADINGSSGFAGAASTRGLEPSIFNGMDFVMAGHIHKHQEINTNGTPIVYSSSLIQKDFGETITHHGYVLWDVSENSYQFVELKNTERGYYKFEISDISDIENNKEQLKNL